MTILGVDVTNWLHTLWHACGEEAPQRAVTRLQAAIDFVKPSAVVLCCDRHSFRHELLPTYKSGRPAKPPGLVDALWRGEELLSKFGALATEEGFEADDGLATLAASGVAAGEKVVIASPDKDLRQCLVADRVTLLTGFKTDRGRLIQPQWFTAGMLEIKHGLTPTQWPDYQALVGEPGDAIAGCPGWGPVTAAKALQEAGSLKVCLDNPWKLSAKPRLLESLTKFKPRAELTLQLVTLRRDVCAVFDALR